MIHFLVPSLVISLVCQLASQLGSTHTLAHLDSQVLASC